MFQILSPLTARTAPESPLLIELLGLAGPLGSITVDRICDIGEVRAAIVKQCGLPAWQYKLVDGVQCLDSLASLAISDATTGIPTASITLVRQADVDLDRRIVQEAIENDDLSVLQVALASGFEVDDGNLGHNGF